jgi:hypothetical protein
MNGFLERVLEKIIKIPGLRGLLRHILKKTIKEYLPKEFHSQTSKIVDSFIANLPAAYIDQLILVILKKYIS